MMERRGRGEIKWANDYCSKHRILLVGEGDFSFSLSLAKTFGSASNLVATSLDSYDTLLKKYKGAKSNLESLKKLGAIVLHEVNVRNMVFHHDLRMWKFDRIVFNFPHSGFIGKEDNTLVIGVHRHLVHDFFCNAIHMLSPNAEIHISHKIGEPFNKWNLVELAYSNSLVLTECKPFRIEHYPGYANKRGDWPRSDDPFPLGECSTFKFKIQETRKRKSPCRNSFLEIANAERNGFWQHGLPRNQDYARNFVGNSNTQYLLPSQDYGRKKMAGGMGYFEISYYRSLISRFGGGTTVSGDFRY